MASVSFTISGPDGKPRTVTWRVREEVAVVLMQQFTSTFGPAGQDWCEPDDCPVGVCNGPHATHPEDDKHAGTVQGKVGDTCPFCKKEF